jgi:hypothetical protein
MATGEVVRLVIGKGKPVDQQERYKIIYRMRDLRDVTEATGKSVFDLLNDPFGGWPHLLHFGLRFAYPKMTPDGAADLIDRWKDDDPEVNEYAKLGELLMNALEASGFVKFPKAGEVKEDEAGEAPAQG